MPSITVNKGDVWRLGPHQIICSDCTNPAVIEQVCGSTTIDAVISDPPYGVAVASSKRDLKIGSEHQDILNDHLQTDAEYATFSKSWMSALVPHLSPKNSWYIFNSDKMLFALKQALDETDIHFGQLLIWIKSQPVIGRLDYLPQHELIVYGWYGRHAFRKSKDKSLLYCPKPRRSKLHPTMKPISLLRRLILNSTKIGDTVCDSFLGSGSTLLACEQTKRRCLGVELSPEYCQVTIERYEKLTGIKAEKVTSIHGK